MVFLVYLHASQTHIFRPFSASRRLFHNNDCNSFDFKLCQELVLPEKQTVAEKLVTTFWESNPTVCFT